MKNFTRKGFIVYNKVSKQYNCYNNNSQGIFARSEEVLTTPDSTSYGEDRTFLKIYPDRKAAEKSISKEWHYGEDSVEYQKRFVIIPVTLTYELDIDTERL